MYIGMDTQSGTEKDSKLNTVFISEFSLPLLQ